MTYLLDANVFIQAKNLHYGIDFCPAFWDWLIEGNHAQKVFSIDKVAAEINAGGDELAEERKSQVHPGKKNINPYSQVLDASARLNQSATF